MTCLVVIDPAFQNQNGMLRDDLYFMLALVNIWNPSIRLIGKYLSAGINIDIHFWWVTL